MEMPNNPTIVNTELPIKPILKTKKVPKKLLFVLGTIFAIIIFLSIITYVFAYLPAKKISNQIVLTKIEALKLKENIAAKDLAGAKNQLTLVQNNLDKVSDSVSTLSYLNLIPYIRNYYQDGVRFIKIANDSVQIGHTVIQAVEPYQDFLGLKGSSTSSAKTTEDRIAFLTQSIEGVLPHLDSIETKVSDIDKLLSEIDISKYPETYQNYNIKQIYNQARDAVSQGSKLISDGRPILTKSSWLLGKDKARNYLVIFQNDGELRPSGGFWTAYATIKVDKGKVIPGPASNIYDLDDALSSTVPSPRLIKAYHINVPYLNLRDNNLSPDFPTDAQIFLDTFYKVTGKKTTYDAVIALDTQVLVNIVKVLGKLDTRVGTFTTNPDPRCDGCPKIIYDLEWISGRPRNYIEKNRKDFLAPLMSALLSNAMGAQKDTLPLLGQAFFQSLFEKHLMFYFPDADMQKASVMANIAGNITQTPPTTDYFHLNDANFASAKSNIFITQKIKHEVTITNNQVKHKVSVTYTNPSKASNCNLEKGDLCLNAPKYRDLFRFYTPIGSSLTKMTGSEVEPVVYEELGKQVFEGFYGDKYPLYAQTSSKVTIEYQSGVAYSKNYSLLLQKQPGTKNIPYEVYLNGKLVESFFWSADKNLKLSL
ncbi:MAG: DUF4012 domain-containing protein [Candidatus Shapirobacteria bacterium]